MKHSIRLLSLILLFSAQHVFAQQDLREEYRPLRCVGEVPLLMQTSTSKKYADQVALEISKEEQKALRRQKDAFYITANYQIDDLLRSGDVIYGDEISTYLNRLMGDIVTSNGLEEVAGGVQVFTVRSHTVNAFSTDQGVIFFTTGLFGLLENEAQVAYVLCHELVHYLRKHNVNSYVKREELEQERLQVGTSVVMDRMSRYSKENELVADGEGAMLYVPLGYPKEEARRALERLAVSHAAVHSGDFDWMNVMSYSLPKMYADTMERRIMPKLDEDDSQSSHPRLDLRLQVLDALVADEDSVPLREAPYGGFGYDRLRDMALMETIREHMLELNYCRTLYEAVAMQNRYPDNRFLRKVVSHSLYALARISVSDAFEEYQVFTPAAEGGERSLQYTLENMQPVQLATIALHYSLAASIDLPEESVYESYALELAKEIGRQGLGADNYLEEYVYYVKDRFHLNLLKEFGRERVEDILDRGAERSMGRIALDEDGSEEMGEGDERPEAEDLHRKSSWATFNDHRRLDLRTEVAKRVLVYAPKAICIDKNNLVDIVESERKQALIEGVIQTSAAAAGVEVVMLSNADLDADDTALLNDMAELDDLIGELSSRDGLLPFVSLSEDLKQRTGTDRLLFSRMSEEHVEVLTYPTFIKALALVSIPDIISKAIAKQKKVDFDFALIDLDDEGASYVESSRRVVRNNAAMLRSKYYELFYTISH